MNNTTFEINMQNVQIENDFLTFDFQIEISMKEIRNHILSEMFKTINMNFKNETGMIEKIFHNPETIEIKPSKPKHYNQNPAAERIEKEKHKEQHKKFVRIKSKTKTKTKNNSDIIDKNNKINKPLLKRLLRYHNISINQDLPDMLCYSEQEIKDYFNGSDNINIELSIKSTLLFSCPVCRKNKLKQNYDSEYNCCDFCALKKNKGEN